MCFTWTLSCTHSMGRSAALETEFQQVHFGGHGVESTRKVDHPQKEGRYLLLCQQEVGSQLFIVSSEQQCALHVRPCKSHGLPHKQNNGLIQAPFLPSPLTDILCVGHRETLKATHHKILNRGSRRSSLGRESWRRWWATCTTWTRSRVHNTR